MATTFNIYSKCYSGRLLVSLSIEVDSNQLAIQDYDFTCPHAAVLRHGNITIDSGLLQDYLSAECHLSHMHNVARVKRDRNRPFFEIDITNLANLEHFCKSLEEGTLQKKLCNRLRQKDVPSSLPLRVMAELHLIVLFNGEWQMRSVTSTNCQECFSLLAKSETFEFTDNNLKITYSMSLLSIDDLATLLNLIIDAAPHWHTIGLLLIPHREVQAIKIEYGNRCPECLSEMLAKWLQGAEPLPSKLVHALAKTGTIGLAKTVAGNFGISFSADDPSFNSNEAFSQPLISKDAYRAGIKLVEQDPSTEPALISKRKELVDSAYHYDELTQNRANLQRNKESVDKDLKDTKSKLEELNENVNKLKIKLKDLAARRERGRTHHCWFTKQQDSKRYSGQDIIILNEVIEDIEMKIKELTEQMNELEEKIANQESMAKQLSDELEEKESERDKLQQELKSLKSKIASANAKLEKNRMGHIEEIQRIRKEAEERNTSQLIAIATKEAKIEVMSQELKHRRDVAMVLASAGESPRTMTPIAIRKRNSDSGCCHDETSTLVTKISMEDEQKRSLSELLSAQESNVNSLKVVLELRAVLRDIKSSGRQQMVTDHQVRCILLNIDDIYQMNSEIFECLQICVNTWRDERMMSFLPKIVQNLEMYETYFNRIKDAMRKLTELMDSQKMVEVALKSFERKQDLVVLQLMLQPLKILPKFCRRLEGYYRCLPNQSDEKALAVKGALSAITEHCHEEEVVKNMGNFAETLTIKRTLKDYPGKILKPGRLFIQKGQLQKISRKGPKNRMFILFSDVLFHTQPDGSHYVVKNEIPLQQMKVIEPEVSLRPHTFEVRAINRSLILSASSEEEKMHWMKCLNEAVRHHEQSSPQLDLNHGGFGSIAPVMVPDESTVMCMLCSSKFTFTLRRHHCYACGIIVCDKCSAKRVYLKYAEKRLRVCSNCYCLAKGETKMLPPKVPSPEAEDLDLLMKREDESVMDGYVTVKEGWQEVKYWYVLTEDRILKKYKAHEDMRAIGTTPLLGYVVTSSTIRLHHPTNDSEELQITFKPATGDYNDWVTTLEQATKLEGEMTPVRRNSKSSHNVAVSTSSSLFRSNTMPVPQRQHACQGQTIRPTR